MEDDANVTVMVRDAGVTTMRDDTNVTVMVNDAGATTIGGQHQCDSNGEIRWCNNNEGRH